MEPKIAAVAGAPDLGQPQVNAGPQPRKGDRASAAKGPDPVEMRLVIEEDQASGSYVYKTINRATGEVVQQLPRAEVLRLREELRYKAGAVIKTKA
jgi:flagellar protein FlaG